MVCKPHNTAGATANRFENDLVRQPQADCFSVSISLIIPHKDRGSLPVSLTQTEPADHRYESDIFSLAFIDTVAEQSLMAEKIYGQLQFELVYPVHRSATQWLGLCSQILFNSPWDSRWKCSGERWQGRVTERDTYLIYCMCSDCTGGLGLAGNSHLLLLFFIIFHQGHLQLTPSETL